MRANLPIMLYNVEYKCVFIIHNILTFLTFYSAPSTVILKRCVPFEGWDPVTEHLVGFTMTFTTERLVLHMVCTPGHTEKCPKYVCVQNKYLKQNKSRNQG